MSRSGKFQNIELAKMDQQPRQGSNSSHTSSEHNLIENQQPRRPHRRRNRGEEADNVENDAEERLYAKELLEN